MGSTNDKIQKMELDMSQVTRSAVSIFNQNQVQKLWNSTHARYKYRRAAKGGGEWTYVKSSYVRKVLDSVFGFNWNFEVETSLAEAFEVAKLTKVCIVKGTLTGRVKVDGQWVEVSKTQFGRSEVKFKRNGTDLLDFGNDMKAATSDCLKKCASMFGVASDIYEADEFMEITITNSDEQKQAATQAKVDRARKEVMEQEAETVGGQNE